MNAAAVSHALHALRSYVTDAADRKAWDQQHTAELSEMIRSCVESLGSNRESQVAARLPLEAIRHAMRYVDERLDAVVLD